MSSTSEPSPTYLVYIVLGVLDISTMTTPTATNLIRGASRLYLLVTLTHKKHGDSIYRTSGLFRSALMQNLMMTVTAGTASWLRGSISSPISLSNPIFTLKTKTRSPASLLFPLSQIWHLHNLKLHLMVLSNNSCQQSRFHLQHHAPLVHLEHHHLLDPLQHALVSKPETKSHSRSRL